MEVGEMNYGETLLDSIVKHEEKSASGFIVTKFKLNGDAHAGAIVDAVAAQFDAMNDDELLALEGQKVTLLTAGQNMMGAGSIVAREGRVFDGSRAPAFLPKGSTKNGISLSRQRVLGYRDGYGQTAWFRDKVAEVRAQFPQVDELTQEHLNALPEPDGGEESAPCTLALFGTLQFIDGPIPGCVWLLADYQHEDGIANGVLFVPPSIACSEHSSVYSTDLLRSYGVVRGFEPISFADALSLVFTDYDEILARVMGRDGALVS